MKFLLVFVCQLSLAQQANNYSAIDSKMAQIPQNLTYSTTDIARYISSNFASRPERLRAAYYWTAMNIEYDLANANNPLPGQKPEEKIAAPLQSRKGVCMHYAEVFRDIADKMDIEVLLIGGYSKVNGKVAALSHQWCASKVGGKWYLFDPTWGGGYAINDRYVKRLSNKYFMAEPKSLIVSHMPFDYLWQFSEHPITNQEFYDGKTEGVGAKFDFEGEIERYRQLSEIGKTEATVARIEKSGLKNSLVKERLDFERQKINNLKEYGSYLQIKDIIDNFNKANTLFNQFIDYRNNRFRPLVSDEELKNKIGQPYAILLQCESDAGQVENVSKENAANFNDLKKAISSAKKNMEEHLDFVNRYLSKSKAQRELMFYTTVFRKRT